MKFQNRKWICEFQYRKWWVCEMGKRPFLLFYLIHILHYTWSNLATCLILCLIESVFYGSNTGPQGGGENYNCWWIKRQSHIPPNTSSSQPPHLLTTILSGFSLFGMTREIFGKILYILKMYKKMEISCIRKVPWGFILQTSR